MKTFFIFQHFVRGELNQMRLLRVGRFSRFIYRYFFSELLTDFMFFDSVMNAFEVLMVGITAHKGMTDGYPTCEIRCEFYPFTARGDESDSRVSGN